MQLDDWVLCRIYKKKNVGRSNLNTPKVEESFGQIAAATHENYNQNHVLDQQQQPTFKFPRTHSLTHLWELGYMGSISQLLNDDSSYDNNGNFSITEDKIPLTDSTKSHVHQTTFVNPVYEFQ